MGKYREFMTKGECLVNALLQTLILMLQFGLLLFASPALSLGSRGLFALLILLQLASCAFHWYRCLAYDKKQSGGLL